MRHTLLVFHLVFVPAAAVCTPSFSYFMIVRTWKWYHDVVWHHVLSQHCYTRWQLLCTYLNTVHHSWISCTFMKITSLLLTFSQVKNGIYMTLGTMVSSALKHYQWWWRWMDANLWISLQKSKQHFKVLIWKWALIVLASDISFPWDRKRLQTNRKCERSPMCFSPSILITSIPTFPGKL